MDLPRSCGFTRFRVPPSTESVEVDGFDEVIKEFLVESYESLDSLDSDLVALEDTPDDRDRLASIFRTVHTIKGTSGFLALPKLERVAHVGENLLVPLRDGALELNADIADGLLAMVDAIREILGHLESDGGEGDTDFEPLVDRLRKLLEGDSAEQQQEAPPAEVPPEAEPLAEGEAQAVVEALAAEQAAAEPTDAAAPEQDAAAPAATTPQAAKAPAEQPVPPAAPQPPPAPEPKPEAAAPPQKPARKPERKKSDKGSDGERRSMADATVRIDVEILDKLMNLVGELVLSRNQILQFCSESDDATMIAACQRLNHITTELQEGVMKTRMQPIRNAWSKLPRVVRDLSSTCGKKVEVRMEGADTELDKTILEAIKDPLTHIVRNSVDHGIEPPDVRAANGKPAEGILLLRAFHEGGQVNIEIIDDGGGINADRIREKAIEKGLITEEQAETMNERELTSLILLPGFSTAAKVTNVSGRGVGMDVVKTNIERIGGTLDIQSTPGHGTTLRIKIPLTLAIVPALITRTGGDSYAIPQVSLLELVRLEGHKATEDIEFIHDAPVYRLRDTLLPLVYLDEQLGLRSRRVRGDEQDNVNIVVLQAEDRQFGLVVEAVTDTQEIVVKPLGQQIKGIPTYAGATIMGDGTVALILDVLGLAHKSGVLTEHRDRSISDKQHSDDQINRDTESLLIVDTSEGLRAAVRLSTVARLEEFAVRDIEQSGQMQVVQYRSEILPLISLGGGYGGAPMGDATTLNTVVYSCGEKRVGVVVGRIVDIVRSHKEITPDANNRSIIHGRVTEIVDLESLVRQTLPGFFTESAA